MSGKKRSKVTKSGTKKRKTKLITLVNDQRLLALDISSKAVGWSFWVNEELVRYDKFVLPEKLGHGGRLCHFRDELTHLMAELLPTRVVYEAPYQGRMRKVFGVLSMYIGMLKAMYFEVSGVDLADEDGIAAHLVKRRIGARRGRSHDENKRIVVQLVNERFGIALAYNATDRSKRLSDDDVADAIAVGWSVFISSEPEKTLGKEEDPTDGTTRGRSPQRRRRNASPRAPRQRRTA